MIPHQLPVEQLEAAGGEYRMKFSKGFTLIELLVTITIISILAVIGLTTYGVFIKSARDARRESDLKFIQSALEQYHGDQKYYPLSGSIIQNTPITNTTGAVSITPAPAPRIYLNTAPSDPVSTQSYSYKSYQDSGALCANPAEAGKCVKYCIFAKRETKTTPEFPLGCSDNAYNFAVTSP